MPYPKEDVCAVVLAGGMGRRLGGMDKGLLKKNHRAFVAYINEALRSQVGEVLISANRNIEEYRKYGRVVTDELPDFQGPLAGMLSAMKQCETEWLVTLPCDGIDIPDDYAERLYSCAVAKSALVAVAHDGKRIQPVHACLHRSLAADLAQYLQSGKRKIDHWYATQLFVHADFSDCPDTFRNVNTPEDKMESGAE